MDNPTSSSDILFKTLVNSSLTPASCHLLTVGSLRLLLDCGIDESYSSSHLDLLLSTLRSHPVDYILLSHSALSQVGALPYLQSQGVLDSGVKLMSTSPTSKMSYLTLYEYFIQRKELDDFSLFSLQDVEKVFEKVELLSFNEHRKIRGGVVEDVHMKDVSGGLG